MKKLKAVQLRIDRADANVYLVLILVFVMRWLLSDNQSYWNDELSSVIRYGIANPTVGDAIEKLTQLSIHPPLYQFILFYWMKIAGDTEVAFDLVRGPQHVVGSVPQKCYGKAQDAADGQGEEQGDRALG